MCPLLPFVSLSQMNLYEQQAANRRKTWLIMSAFVLVLLFLGAGFDAFYIGEAGGFVPVGSLLAVTNVKVLSVNRPLLGCTSVAGK